MEAMQAMEAAAMEAAAAATERFRRLFVTCEKKNFFASMLVCLFVQTFV